MLPPKERVYPPPERWAFDVHYETAAVVPAMIALSFFAREICIIKKPASGASEILMRKARVYPYCPYPRSETDIRK